MNILFQFKMNAQVADIAGFIISYNIPGGSRVQAYHYPRENIPEVITDGLTFANNIPLSNRTGDEVQVLVFTIVDRVIVPRSSKFTTTQCGAALNSTIILAGN